MSIQRNVIVLFVFLLLSQFLIIYAAAESGSTDGEVFAVDTFKLPVLRFDSSQEIIIVDKELSPVSDYAVGQKERIAITSEQLPAVTIPFGAIIHHSNDGITTVFDSTGKQLFAVDDAHSKLVPTPNGTLPATHVHEVPSGSTIYFRNNRSYVVSGNELIFVEINDTNFESISSHQMASPADPEIIKSAGISSTGGDPSPIWIEWVHRITPDFYGWNRIKEFSAHWTVPAKPRITKQNQVQYLVLEEWAWDTKTYNNGDLVFMPVLEYNYNDEGKWYITAWVHNYHDSSVGYFAKREPVNDGDIITGTISSDYDFGNPPSYSTATSKWSINIHDQSGHTVILDSNLQSLENNWVMIGCQLMMSGETSLESEANLIGDTVFSDFVVLDQNGSLVITESFGELVNSAFLNNPNFLDMKIEDNWPSSIVFRTSPPLKPTYSITSIYYNPFDEPDSRPQLDTECQIVIDELKSAGWGDPIFYKKDLDVKSTDLGFTSGGLAENTFHWHTGHGWYNPEDLDPSSSGVTLLRRDGTTFQLSPKDVAGRWNTKNKWVVLNICLALRDPLWNNALGTTHGIFGFTTGTSGNTNLAKYFFNYAKKEKLTLAQAWRNATIQTYHSIQAPDYVQDPKRKIPIVAAVRFDNESQFNNDHLPGFGLIESDEYPHDDNYFYEQWPCVRGT